MTKEYKMFKDLSRKEQLELVEAALDGKDIEMTSVGDDDWIPQPHYIGVSCHFEDEMSYHIAPIEDYIPWEHISDDYQWYISGVLFMDKPIKTNHNTWGDDYDTGISVHLFKGFKKGNISHDAPVKRPKGK